MPAEMIHMNDAELWGSLLDDPRMRQLAEVIDQNAEAGIRIPGGRSREGRHPAVRQAGWPRRT